MVSKNISLGSRWSKAQLIYINSDIFNRMSKIGTKRLYEWIFQTQQLLVTWSKSCWIILDCCAYPIKTRRKTFPEFIIFKGNLFQWVYWSICCQINFFLTQIFTESLHDVCNKLMRYLQQIIDHLHLFCGIFAIKMWNIYQNL